VSLIYGEKYLPDGRWLVVYSLIGGRARLTISEPGNTYTYYDAW
jgi:hypothetical protein